MSRIKGSIFHKSDKDISDALKQQTPGKTVLENHLKARGMLLSPENEKEDTAEYLAPWFTSFFDQKFIVEEKGGGSTQKKFNNVEIKSNHDEDELKRIIKDINDDRSLGMNFSVKYNSGSIIIEESYTKSDFTKNVLSQNIPKVAEIKIMKNTEGNTVIRSNNDEQANKITSMIRRRIQENNIDDYEEIIISFAAVTDPSVRTKFFFDLADNIDGYRISDMKSVAVSKINSSESYEYNEDDENSEDDETLAYIKRVMLNGGSVHQAIELKTLLDKGFYITRIEWTMESTLASGDKIDLYAEFKDTINCSNLVYSIQKVYTKKKDGSFVISGKLPSNIDNDSILPKIENSAKRSFDLAMQDTNAEQLEESDDEDN